MKGFINKWSMKGFINKWSMKGFINKWSMKGFINKWSSKITANERIHQQMISQKPPKPKRKEIFLIA